jgi:hypothetical protein
LTSATSSGFLDEYLDAAGIRDHAKTPLFCSAVGRTGLLTELAMHRIDAYQMVRRRTAEAGLKGKLGCHAFGATAITAYLKAGARTHPDHGRARKPAHAQALRPHRLRDHAR